MGVISQNESSTTTLFPSNNLYSDQDVTTSRDHPKHSTELIDPTPQYARPDDTVIAREEANAKTFINKTAYDPQRYPDVYGTLMQYVSGTPIRVTYYRQIHSDGEVQTNFGDNDVYEDYIHSDLEQILNFEFRTESAFSFNWDDDKKEGTFSGEGIVYPGFEVSVGDMFTYKIGDSIGLFKIDSFEPLSIRQSSYQRITFSLFQRLDNAEYNNLIQRTGSTVVFDLQKYLSGGLVLLESESYIQLERLREMRISLAKYYSHTFYDRNIHSYIRPDGIYDPYLVRYMSKKISAFDTKVSALQLVTIYDYEDSLWSLMTENRHDVFKIIKAYTGVNVKRDGVFTTLVNGIINREYISLHREPVFNSETYVLSEAFYLQQRDNMSLVEKLVYDYVTTGTVDVTATLSVVQAFRQLSHEELFYKGGIYLHLIDVAIRTIT